MRRQVSTRVIAPIADVIAGISLALGLAAAGCGRRDAVPAGAAEVEPYREAARRIAEASLAGDGGWRKVAYLTDEIGPRLSGTPELGRAVAWARDTFAAEGHDNVALEAVRVPHWVRGDESAEIVAPARRKLGVLGLGGTVGTPPGGITAELAVVASFEELDRLGPAIKGKIVLFNHAVPATGSAAMNYGQALPFRIAGATRAAARGAVAVLVRSLAPVSLGAPHTGALRYGAGARIPAAAVSVEDAQLLARLAARHAVKVRLALGAETLADADSANVVAEIRGRETPDEIVVIGAHIDSWDVGEGAQDDGAGCATVMESLATLRRLGLIPRRTIRAVLFTAEEEGAGGGKQYAATHKAELPRHVAAFETDMGAGAPRGFSVAGTPPPPWTGEARALAGLLAPLGATTVRSGFAGADVAELGPAGVPLFGLLADESHYFDVHHSAADTLEKIDPANLRRSVGALATMAFIVAERPQRWPPTPPPAPSPPPPSTTASAPATPAAPAPAR